MRRSHQKIIDDAEGPTAVARLIGAEPGTVKQWRRLSSIPAPYWDDLTKAGIATLEELAAAAATRRAPKQPEASAA